MNSELLDLFKQYRGIVSSDEAAASLTLADVLLDSAPKEEPAMLNPGDVAKQLRVSPDTVLNWIRSGQLKAANIAKG